MYIYALHIFTCVLYLDISIEYGYIFLSFFKFIFIYIHIVLFVFTYVCLQMIIYTYSNTISALQPLRFCRGRTTMYAKAKTKVLPVRFRGGADFFVC